jgi:hypothetical protein
LTYVGPAGWGAKMTSGGRSVAVTQSGRAALKKSIRDVGAGRTARDASVGKILGEFGLTKAADESAEQFIDRATRTLQGSRRTGAVGVMDRALQGLGGDAVRVAEEGKGGLVDAFYSGAVTPQTAAVREFVERYGRGTGRSIKIGTGGAIGSEVGHVPFTDWTLQVPAFTQEARNAANASGIARIRDIGRGADIAANAAAMPTYQAVVQLADIDATMRGAIDEMATARGQMDELLKTPAGDPAAPAPSLTPAPGGVANVVNVEQANKAPAFQIGDVVNTKVESGWPSFGEQGKPITDIQFADDGSAYIFVQGERVGIPAERLDNLSRPDTIASEMWAQTSRTPQPTPGLQLTGEQTGYQPTLYDPGAQADATLNPGGRPVSAMDPQQAIKDSLQSELRRTDEVLNRAVEDADAILYNARLAAAGTNPAKAAESLTDAQALLAQSEAINVAQDQVRSARHRRDLYRTLIDQQNVIASLPPAEAARLVAEDNYHLVMNNPERLQVLADVAEKSLEAAMLHAEAVKAPLIQMLDTNQKTMLEYVKNFTGLDEDGIAISLFGQMSNAIKGRVDGENGLTDRLDKIDRFIRNTFNVRGGNFNKQVVRLHNQFSQARENAQIVRHELEKSALRAAKETGLVDADTKTLPDVMRYIHLKAHEAVDPQGTIFRTWKFKPGMTWDDVAAGNTQPSALKEALAEMSGRGVLADPKIRAALDAEATGLVRYYQDALRAEQAVNATMLGLPGYVGPNVPTRDADKLIQSQVARTRTNATGTFQTPRTMHSVVFEDPQTKELRRFFIGDTHLIEDFPDVDPAIIAANKSVPTVQYDAAGNMQPLPVAYKYAQTPEERIREIYRDAPGVAEMKIEARAAAKRYNELVKTDPAFKERAATDFRPMPTDPVELNELAQTGYFDNLTGGVRGVDGIFEYDAGAVLEHHYAAAQRIGAKRQMFQYIADVGLKFDRDAATPIAGITGRPFKTANNVDGVIDATMKSSFGNEVIGVKIGSERYRTLDPKVWDDMGEQLLALEGVEVKNYLVPQKVADKIEDMVRVFDETNFTQLLDGIDRFTSIWKMLTLMHPSWTIGNVVGNSSLAMMGGARPQDLFRPDWIRKATMAAWHDTPTNLADDATVTLGGTERSIAEIRQLANDHRILKNNLALEAIGRFVENKPGVMAASERFLRKHLAPWFRANQKADDTLRLLAFMSHLDQGNSPAAAAAKVLESMYDYGDFTSTERAVFRRLMPFYSWIRSNLGYQMKLLMERPMYAALAPKLRESLEEMMAGEAAVPMEMRPSWMRSNLAAQIGKDPDSRFALMFGQGVIPSTDIYNIMLPLVGAEGAMKFLHYFASGLNPALTTPLQLATGVDFFAGRSISPDITSDLTPGEFLLGNVRPVAEYGPGGKVQRSFERGIGQGVSRAVLGGRVQAMDAQRIESSRERELREEEVALRSAVRRAERLGESSLEARARLLKHYQKMSRLSFDIPNWAEEQLQASPISG